MAIKAIKRRFKVINIATDNCVDCKRTKENLRANSLLCSNCFNRQLKKKLDA